MARGCAPRSSAATRGARRGTRRGRRRPPPPERARPGRSPAGTAPPTSPSRRVEGPLPRAEEPALTHPVHAGERVDDPRQIGTAGIHQVTAFPAGGELLLELEEPLEIGRASCRER